MCVPVCCRSAVVEVLQILSRIRCNDSIMAIAEKYHYEEVIYSHQLLNQETVWTANDEEWKVDQTLYTHSFWKQLSKTLYSGRRTEWKRWLNWITYGKRNAKSLEGSDVFLWWIAPASQTSTKYRMKTVNTLYIYIHRRWGGAKVYGNEW